MNLKNIKKQIDDIKKDMVIDETPNYPNFFNFCKKYYGRDVHMSEIWSNEYWIGINQDRKKVKSNPILFLQLSNEYYTKRHGIPNPVKDDYKGLLSIYWQDNICADNDIKGLGLMELLKLKQYNEWFEDTWNTIINSELNMPNRYIVDSGNNESE